LEMLEIFWSIFFCDWHRSLSNNLLCGMKTGSNWNFFSLWSGEIILLLTAIGRHWGPVILTSATIGSPGLGRYTLNCDWMPLRPSDFDFGHNWKPRTWAIPLLLTAIGRHWGPVILTLATIGSPGLGRYTLNCDWTPLRPSDFDFGHNWKPRTGEIYS
jgi:hypothetical protein